MSDNSFARLEAHIERLIEGTFAQLFGKTTNAREMAVYIARAMQGNMLPASGEDPRPIAPEEYSIFLSAAERRALLARQPDIEILLGAHVAQMAEIAGCRLSNEPLVRVLADNDLPANGVRVLAGYRRSPSATAVLERVTNPSTDMPHNAYLLMNGMTTIPLDQPVLLIGRSRDNDLVLDDQFTSRHHAQLRLRFGAYTIFDTNSSSGIYVNNVRVNEYMLQTGDVIKIGNTHLVYFDDSAPDQYTEPLPSVDE